MGRPPKNPNHPFARLRDTLGITREMLAKRTGIPEASLKDIETGRYKLTAPVALKFTYALGVSAQSLLTSEDPLLDYLGRPFTKDSRRLPEAFLWPAEAQEVREQLFFAAWDTVREKKLSLLLADSFETWLISTFQALGLEELLAKKLTDRLLLFDPSLVPEDFRPEDKQLAKKWEIFEEQVQEEFHRIRRQDRVDDSAYYARVDNTPATAEFVTKMNDLRVEARKRVRERIEAASNTSSSKPLSGKRPRSPGRPAA
jgi:DNA-binding XRE family transcriptional regulator